MLKNAYWYYYCLENKDEKNDNRKKLKYIQLNCTYGFSTVYTMPLAWATPLEIPKW
jgi:hypothetical protein